MAELSPLSFFLVTIKQVTCFAGRVNGTPADPFNSIDWNGGATGSASSIGTSGAPVEGNTIFFGSTAGGRERGLVRLRSWTPSNGSGTAGTMITSENDDVSPNIEDDDFITVKLFWQLWDKVPRQDASNPSNILFFEDFDIGYNQQTVDWRPMAVAGPPAVEFLEAGQAAASFIGERSYALAPGATLSSFLWTAHGSNEGTSSSQGTVGSPVTFTWVAAGQHLVTLKVTDSNGIDHTNYTWAIVIDPADPTAVAYTKFDAISDNSDALQGGGSCNFTVHGVADVSQFPTETLVLHIARGTQTTPTATWPNRANILYAGYITGNSIRQDPVNNTTSFRTVTIDGLMKKLSIYPVRLSDSSNPQNWTQAKDLTVDRVLSYLAHWRSTLSLMTNIRPLNYTAELKSQDFNAANLFGMFKSLMGDAWGLPIADHQSVLHLVRDFNLQTTAERATATTRKTLHKGIWVAPIDIAERGEYEQPVRKVKWNGVFYPGDGAAAIPLFSEAPGDVMDSWGNEQARSGLILTTQDDLNIRTGFAYSRANQRYPGVQMRFLNDSSFTVAPQEIFPANIEAADNNRGLVWTPDLIPRSIRRSYDHIGGFIDYRITFEPSVTGPGGITVVAASAPMPAKPASATGGGVAPSGDPPPAPPAWPPLTVPIAGPAVGADTTDGVYITFDSGASWAARNNLLTNPDQLAFQYLIWDPWWFTPDKKGTNDPEQVILWGCGLGFVVKSEDAGKTWENLTQNIDDPPNSWSDSPAPTVADVTFINVQGNIHSKDEFIFIGNATMGGLERAWLLRTDDDGVTSSWLALGAIVPDTAGSTIATVNVPGTSATRVLISSALTVGTWYAMDGSAGPITFDPPKVSFAMSYALTAGVALGTGLIGRQDFLPFHLSPPNWTTATRAEAIDADYGRLLWKAQQTSVYSVFNDSAYGDNSGSMDQVLRNVNTIDGIPEESQALGMDTDNENGAIVWVTSWSDNWLLLQKRATADMVLTTEYNMGTTTLADVTARTFFAYPYTPGLDRDVLYLFGRMNAPQSLANPEHIIKTIDGGSSWSSVGDSATWGADWIGAFFEDASGNIFAFRNGASRALYRSVDGGATWTSLSSLPFDVDPGGMSVHPDGRILISNRDAGAQTAAYGETPDYSSWIDATGNPSFPVATPGSGSNSIIWIT